MLFKHYFAFTSSQTLISVKLTVYGFSETAAISRDNNMTKYIQKAKKIQAKQRSYTSALPDFEILFFMRTVQYNKNISDISSSIKNLETADSTILN